MSRRGCEWKQAVQTSTQKTKHREERTPQLNIQAFASGRSQCLELEAHSDHSFGRHIHIQFIDPRYTLDHTRDCVLASIASHACVKFVRLDSAVAARVKRGEETMSESISSHVAHYVAPASGMYYLACLPSVALYSVHGFNMRWKLWCD